MTAIFPGHYRTALHFTTIEVEYWKYLKTEVTLHRLQNIGEFPDLSMQYFILIKVGLVYLDIDKIVRMTSYKHLINIGDDILINNQPLSLSNDHASVYLVHLCKLSNV